MNVAEIRDPKLRRRIEEADARQNQKAAPAGKGIDTSPLIPLPVRGGEGANRKRQAKRVRQDSRPLLNQLELNFYARLLAAGPNKSIRLQAVRYRLGNGIWYKPDFTCVNWPIADGECGPVAWEVKGPKAFRGGFENLKVAAALYPEVRWILVWKDKETGKWMEQEMLP